MAPVMWTQMPALAGHQLLLLLAVLLGLLQLRLPRPRQQLRHAWCAQEACMHLPDGSLLLASPIGARKVSAVREGQPSAFLHHDAGRAHDHHLRHVALVLHRVVHALHVDLGIEVLARHHRLR
jgi:hypothetical protein